MKATLELNLDNHQEKQRFEEFLEGDKWKKILAYALEDLSSRATQRADPDEILCNIGNHCKTMMFPRGEELVKNALERHRRLMRGDAA